MAQAVEAFVGIAPKEILCSGLGCAASFPNDTMSRATPILRHKTVVTLIYSASKLLNRMSAACGWLWACVTPCTSARDRAVDAYRRPCYDVIFLGNHLFVLVWSGKQPYSRGLVSVARSAFPSLASSGGPLGVARNHVSPFGYCSSQTHTNPPGRLRRARRS